jgi:pimeloyl-ACP methyl ester carboxylesterase
VKAAIYNTLYFPNLWPTLALQLGALAQRDATLIAAAFGGDIQAFFLPDTSVVEAQNGIKCSDQRKYSQRADWEVVRAARHASSYFGDVADIVVTCARWLFDAKEKYTGNFTVTTRRPVLLIGNTADPITPIASARNASAGYQGSVVLQHDSSGHCSHLTQGSLCTARAIRAYFLEGVLPEPNTVCEVDVAPFTGSTGWNGIVEQLGPV